MCYSSRSTVLLEICRRPARAGGTDLELPQRRWCGAHCPLPQERRRLRRPDSGQVVLGVAFKQRIRQRI